MTYDEDYIAPTREPFLKMKCMDVDTHHALLAEIDRYREAARRLSIESRKFQTEAIKLWNKAEEYRRERDRSRRIACIQYSKRYGTEDNEDHMKTLESNFANLHGWYLPNTKEIIENQKENSFPLTNPRYLYDDESEI